MQARPNMEENRRELISRRKERGSMMTMNSTAFQNLGDANKLSLGTCRMLSSSDDIICPAGQSKGSRWYYAREGRENGRGGL